MNRLHRAMVLVALCAAPVFPCGGPGSYPIDAPLVTIDRTLQAVESGQDDYESRRRVELRFLAPFRGSPGVNDALWAYAYPDAVWNALPGYDSSASFVLPDSAPLLAALRRGDGAAASAAARTIVDRALGLPAGVADAYAGLTNRALEWLDDAPRLTSTPRAAFLTTFWRDSAPPAGVLPLRDLYAARHIARDSIATWLTAHPASPYAAALEFAAIKRAMQTQIPNGWANEVRDSVPATTWRALRQLHQDWLGAHAADARAPWVRFSRARLAYFAGDTAQTWEPWLALYATGTHRPRVLSEMRYLVMQGMLPAEDARTDVALQAALLTERRLTVAQWNRAWDATAGAVPAVRLTTQERLLWHVAHRPLADSMDRLTSFPRLPAVPSSLWGEMRGVALARAGRRVAALEQLRLLPTDTLVAPLRAQLLLGERRYSPGTWLTE